MKFFVIVMFAISGPAFGTVLSPSEMQSEEARTAPESAMGDDAPDLFEDLFGAKKSLVVFKRQKVTLFENVEFDSGRASLNAKSEDTLTQVSTILIERPDISLLQIDAHTDSLGSSERNRELSLARAQAVVAYLVNLGVDQRRLVAVGHGESKPVMPNDSSENRAANRRTEIRIVSLMDEPPTLAAAGKSSVIKR